ncbi:MAG: hypothetical protein K0S08_1534 [Gammaproteobacteria bacterium]|jgi:hypothetical protein|nr:hypothetical protein [Gammaproteobacteria bacterium]
MPNDVADFRELLKDDTASPLLEEFPQLNSVQNEEEFKACLINVYAEINPFVEAEKINNVYELFEQVKQAWAEFQSGAAAQGKFKCLFLEMREVLVALRKKTLPELLKQKPALIQVFLDVLHMRIEGARGIDLLKKYYSANEQQELYIKIKSCCTVSELNECRLLVLFGLPSSYEDVWMNALKLEGASEILLQDAIRVDNHLAFLDIFVGKYQPLFNSIVDGDEHKDALRQKLMKNHAVQCLRMLDAHPELTATAQPVIQAPAQLNSNQQPGPLAKLKNLPIVIGKNNTSLIEELLKSDGGLVEIRKQLVSVALAEYVQYYQAPHPQLPTALSSCAATRGVFNYHPDVSSYESLLQELDGATVVEIHPMFKRDPASQKVFLKLLEDAVMQYIPEKYQASIFPSLKLEVEAPSIASPRR